MAMLDQSYRARQKDTNFVESKTTTKMFLTDKENKAMKTGIQFALKDQLLEGILPVQRYEITSDEIERISNPSRWSQDSSRVNFNASKLSSDLGDWGDELDVEKEALDSSHGLLTRKPQNSQPRQESQGNA